MFYLLGRPLSWLLACWVMLTALGCAGNAQFKVQYAPGANRNGARISVFGIKRDGLMSHSGWDALSPELSAPFGAKNCPVAYSDELFATHAPLAEALESYVRQNGVSDEVLNTIAPAAQGDTILLVTSAGRPRSSSSGSAGSDPSAAGRHGMGGGRGGGMGGGRGGGMGGMGGGGGRRGAGFGAPMSSEASSSSDDYQLTALFFSVAEHKTVALIELSYSGTSAAEAIAQFRNRLESEFSGASCAGWNFSANIDPSEIRKLASE